MGHPASGMISIRGLLLMRVEVRILDDLRNVEDEYEARDALFPSIGVFASVNARYALFIGATILSSAALIKQLLLYFG